MKYKISMIIDDYIDLKQKDDTKHIAGYLEAGLKYIGFYPVICKVVELKEEKEKEDASPEARSQASET